MFFGIRSLRVCALSLPAPAVDFLFVSETQETVEKGTNTVILPSSRHFGEQLFKNLRTRSAAQSGVKKTFLTVSHVFGMGENGIIKPALKEAKLVQF
jgi:hypothetical protein